MELLVESEEVFKKFLKLSNKIDEFRTKLREKKVHVDLSVDDVRIIKSLLNYKESFNMLGEYILELLCNENVVMDSSKKTKLKNMLTCSLEENIFS